MERIECGFFDAGGGHRAAATALQMVCETQRRPWDVRLTNLQELMDPLDIVKKYGLAGIVAGGAAHFKTQQVDHNPYEASQ